MQLRYKSLQMMTQIQLWFSKENDSRNESLGWPKLYKAFNMSYCFSSVLSNINSVFQHSIGNASQSLGLAQCLYNMLKAVKGNLSNRIGRPLEAPAFKTADNSLFPLYKGGN